MVNKKLKQHYIPMTETAFYILLSLVSPKHGYAIIDHVEKLTKKRISLGPGTIYGTLSKMKKDGLIEPVKEESNRKIYQITPMGKEILDSEKARIEELYFNSKGGL